MFIDVKYTYLKYINCLIKKKSAYMDITWSIQNLINSSLHVACLINKVWLIRFNVAFNNILAISCLSFIGG
jgi:hypothetical protein